MQHSMQYESFGRSKPSTFTNKMPLFSSNILAIVLAGGRGERLHPLTEHRAKPAVPFGGVFRLIDFVLSNMLNSGVRHIYIPTQYKSHSLLRHLRQGWTITLPPNRHFIMPVHAQMQGRDTLYLGTADAVYKHFHLIMRAQPDLTLVFGADHVYSMDVRQMIQYHLEKGAEVTVATIPMPLTQCSQFGTVLVDDAWKIQQFKEKVSNPTPIPNRPDQALVSMGNYIFSTSVLLEELEEDAHDSNSSHDFGRDILPKLCEKRSVYAYDFRTNVIPEEEHPTDYWRDVGTIESYYHANMDMLNPLSHLNLYNEKWPVRSLKHYDLPAKAVEDLYGKRGCAENSIFGGSNVIAGGYVRDSVIGNNVHILSGAVVEESVILGDVVIGVGAKIRRTIIDHGNIIGTGERIGYDRDHDASRYYIDDSGIVVVPHHHLN